MLPRPRQLFRQLTTQLGEHPADARIIELAGDRWVDRNIFIRRLECDVIALPLLANVTQRVLCAALVVFVEDNQIGKVEHVDFFELARCTVIAGHDVNREIDQVDDLTVALADARCLNNDKIETERLEEMNLVRQHLAGRKVLPSRCNRAHVDAFGAQRIHANTIAQQAPPVRRRVGSTARPQSSFQERSQKTIQNFVGYAALAGTTGAGNADYRNFAGLYLPFLAQGGHFDSPKMPSSIAEIVAATSFG